MEPIEMNQLENQLNDDISLRRVVMADGNVPWWWKLGVLTVGLYGLLHFAYFHLGTPGRTDIDRFEVALARNTELQYAEIGELKQDASTMVKFLNEPSWLRVGQSIYKVHCVQCHGTLGEGKVGPNLRDDSYKHIRKLEDVLAVINRGAGGNAMPAWQDKLNSNEIVLVSTYVASLRGTMAEGGKGPEGQIIPPWPSPDEVDSAQPEKSEAQP